jgi:hypothetical protein
VRVEKISKTGPPKISNALVRFSLIAYKTRLRVLFQNFKILIFNPLFLSVSAIPDSHNLSDFDYLEFRASAFVPHLF